VSYPIADTIYQLKKSEGRHEVKFIANARTVHLVDRWLGDNWAGFKPHWPHRFVNSIYFDDFIHSCYQENLSGATYREKLRLRWYGEAREPINSKLEVKVKKNKIGWKFHEPVSHFNVSDVGPFCLDLLDIAPSFLSVVKAYPVPTLFVNYHRKYFISRDGRVRITVDDRINFDSTFKFRKSSKFAKGHNFPITIVEVKFLVSDFEFASAIIRDMPFKSTRGSKYVIGVQFLNDL
jgi:hypothetical protein